MHSRMENILQQDCVLEQLQESFFNFSFRGFNKSLSKNAHFPTITTAHRRKENRNIAISKMLDDIQVEGVVARTYYNIPRINVWELELLHLSLLNWLKL